MLISSFGHSVDAKGRVFIPAKWRDDLGDTVIITRDMMGNADSRCLYGMPVELWNDILERFKKVAVSDVKAQNAMRRLFANACECELDKQGRILIPNSLREYAGINSDAMLVGMGSRIEIWGAENGKSSWKGWITPGKSPWRNLSAILRGLAYDTIPPYTHNAQRGAGAFSARARRNIRGRNAGRRRTFRGNTQAAN